MRLCKKCREHRRLLFRGEGVIQVLQVGYGEILISYVAMSADEWDRWRLDTLTELTPLQEVVVSKFLVPGTGSSDRCKMGRNYDPFVGSSRKVPSWADGWFR